MTGPLSIVKVNDNGLTYQLRDLDSENIIRAHHSQLRLFKPVPNYLKCFDLLDDDVDVCNPNDNLYKTIDDTVSNTNQSLIPSGKQNVAFGWECDGWTSTAIESSTCSIDHRSGQSSSTSADEAIDILPSALSPEVRSPSAVYASDNCVKPCRGVTLKLVIWLARRVQSQ